MFASDNKFYNFEVDENSKIGELCEELMEHLGIAN
jgi:hypothetical protein